MHRPALVVLDEPTASLDPEVALRVRTGLRELADDRGHRAAGHQPQHGRGGAPVRARGVPVGRSGRRRRVRGRGRRRFGGADLEDVFLHLARGRALTDAPDRPRWRGILAIAQRHWYVLRRSPHRLFDVLLWPVVDMLLFGSIAVFAASRATDGRPAAVAYTLAGMVLWQVVYQSQIAVATGFLEETLSRNLLNLMATPLREWEYVAGDGAVRPRQAARRRRHGGAAGLGGVRVRPDVDGLRPGTDRRAAARRRLGDRAVRDRAGAAFRHRRRGARLGRAVHR